MVRARTVEEAVAQINSGATELSLFRTQQTSMTNFLFEFYFINSSIAGNEIGPEEAKAIVEALKTNTTLKELGLGNDKNEPHFLLFANNSSITVNKIGPDGVRVIAEALKANTTLTQLNLDMMEMDFVSCF